MSVEQFYSLNLFKTIDTSEEIKLGSFTGFDDLEISNIVVKIFIHGNIVGNERMRLKINSVSANERKSLLTSDWSNLYQIEGISEYWYGNLRFDFSSKLKLSGDNTYYLVLETENYTRTSFFYLAIKHDYPEPVNTSSATGTYSSPLEFKIYGYE
jgi:hypothetical protein